MMTKLARRASGLYWVKFNPDEEWTIARLDLTVSSGQPGWELIGLPFATGERGDEETNLYRNLYPCEETQYVDNPHSVRYEFRAWSLRRETREVMSKSRA